MIDGAPSSAENQQRNLIQQKVQEFPNPVSAAYRDLNDTTVLRRAYVGPESTSAQALFASDEDDEIIGRQTYSVESD